MTVPYAGTYTYARAGQRVGRVTMEYDDGETCVLNVYFTSATAGWYASRCVNPQIESYWTGGAWSVAEDTEPPPVTDSSPTLSATGRPGDQTYSVGTAIVPVTLPRATGGDGTLTYSLAPSVPGLTFDPASRRLSGTPTSAGTHRMTYTVTDADGDTDTLSFTITVEEGDGGTTEGECQVGQLVSPGESCNYPGTDDAFSVDDDGRGSFLVISSARAINVNNANFSGRRYDFRASHQGDGVWRIDRLEGSTTPPTGGGGGSNTSPEFPSNAGPGDQTYTVGTAIATLTLPEATGGDGTLTYELSPSIPGLSFDSATRGLTGTPTAAGAHSMTYTVTDGDGDTDTLRFSVVVESADLSPSFVAGSGPEDQTYIVGTAIGELTLPEATGGDGSLTYSLSQEIPGLTFDASTRRLTGTPATAGTYDMTYTVTDEDGDTDTLSFTITVEPDGGIATDHFDLHPDNGNAEGIAFANARFYIPDPDDDKVYAYTAAGQRDAERDFDLDEDNVHVTGITFANDRFYVLDFVDDKVYVHTSDGQRDSASDFDLRDGNDNSSGIAYANTRFYVADWSDDKVYVYTSDGRSNSTRDFDLHRDNDNSVDIGFANDRLYVLDRVDEKAYAYTLDGRRDAASEFDLEEDNGNPEGIAYANGRFYVPYNTDHKVYVYTLDEKPNGGGQSPDLVIESVTVDDATPDSGESITFSALVRNSGDGQSDSTTLRYYRSTNATISRSDTEVGTDAVASLDAGGESRESISLAAPSSAGTYYFGACVDSVSGESDTSNNCSTGLRLTVGGNGDGGGGVPSHPSVSSRFSPPNFFIGDPVDLVLSWNRISGATNYKVYINNATPIFYTQRGNLCTVSSSHHSSTTTRTSYRYRFTAASINHYFFMVQACNSSGQCSCP